MHNASTEVLCDLRRPIAGAGIDDNDFRDERQGRLQHLANRALLVLSNYDERNFCHARACAPFNARLDDSSTPEEVHSLAVVVHRHLPTLEKRLPEERFATTVFVFDVDFDIRFLNWAELDS